MSYCDIKAIKLQNEFLKEEEPKMGEWRGNYLVARTSEPKDIYFFAADGENTAYHW